MLGHQALAAHDAATYPVWGKHVIKGSGGVLLLREHDDPCPRNDFFRLFRRDQRELVGRDRVTPEIDRRQSLNIVAKLLRRCEKEPGLFVSEVAVNDTDAAIDHLKTINLVGRGSVLWRSSKPSMHAH